MKPQPKQKWTWVLQWSDPRMFGSRVRQFALVGLVLTVDPVARTWMVQLTVCNCVAAFGWVDRDIS